MSQRQDPTHPGKGTQADARADSATAACPYGCPRCCALITVDQISGLFSGGSAANLAAAVAAFNEAFMKFSVNKCLRKAHFFAQCREEVGSNLTLAESLNYKSTALGDFSYFQRHPEEAELYGRVDGKNGHPADQEAIANRAYGNRLGNGDVASGDGWQFRGKGFIHLTGRETYQLTQNEMDAKYPGHGLDIMTGSDVTSMRGGMISALAYWSWKHCNNPSDGGDADANVDAVTAIVNKHTKSYAARRTHFGTTKVSFKVAECTNR